MTDAASMRDDWVAGCGETETPFRTRTGRSLLWMWNRTSGEHAYYDVERDVFLSNEETAAAMGLQ